ncbi:MAG: hypothetical protein ACTSQY_09645 [Candidatus Odinarchaeia archaeon]
MESETVEKLKKEIRDAEIINRAKINKIGGKNGRTNSNEQD